MRTHSILENLLAALAVSGSSQQARSRNRRELSGKDLHDREHASKIHTRMYDVKLSDAPVCSLHLEPA
jgi:hypothetical protein